MGTKMPIDKNEITKEMLEKAMQCNTVEELIAYAKTETYCGRKIYTWKLV